MDKLLTSNWFVKIISFLLALMLYTIVAMPDGSTTDPNGLLTQQTETERLPDMELEVLYDEDSVVVSDLPETVDVIVEGRTDGLMLSKLTNKEVYVDLRNLTPGQHLVTVKHRDFPENVDVAIDPVRVSVTIEEKKSSTFQAGINLLKEDELPEGYATEEPIVSPKTVTVTGANSKLEQIAFVRGYVNVSGAKEEVNERITLNVYDANMEEIQGVSIDPAVVDVKVPITAPYKKVPIKLDQKGKLPDGVSISSIDLEPSEVSVFGPEEELGKLEFLDGIPLDLSKITKDTTVELDVPVPDGMKKVDPETVEAKIKVGKEDEKAFEDVPIKVTGVSDGLTANISEPETGSTDMKIYGVSSVLENIQNDDFQAYIDASGLSEGEHELELQWNGPSYVRWSGSSKKVTLQIENSPS
ncbi:YbbR-like domain-containing protein [Alkalihalobacillus hwajinpoensis]|uniref:CdaR family protein n=1 Tax=Guptibacillus hwajinpoensis TaxID=208199 RepID=UPI0018837536|nr:CdaR family protein [Pseudalkalibacillus hwajinpoensis]MBF0709527.1 YbbR-like domain-containing protein [Pseudalkalibacillus hwajinpoensis]